MKHRYLRNVVTLHLDIEKCINCDKCAEVCPNAVFEQAEGHVSISDKDACMECGACAKNCPADAISVRSGVGCAYAITMGWLKGTEATCGCLDDGGGGCC